jgi:acetoin utilization protein AcuB
MTLREVLHAHVPMLAVESTVRDAVDRMDVYQFPALVVLDADRGPVAVVTEGDLCRAATQNGDLLSLAGRPVLDFATKDPVTAQPDNEVADALHVMLSRGLTVLPVVEDGTFVGLVLRVDLMQAMMLDARPIA